MRTFYPLSIICGFDTEDPRGASLGVAYISRLRLSAGNEFLTLSLKLAVLNCWFGSAGVKLGASPRAVMLTPESTCRFFNSYSELLIVGTESEIRYFIFSGASTLNRDTRELLSPLFSISFSFLRFVKLVCCSIMREPWSLRPPGSFWPKTVLLALLLFA